MPSLVYVCTVKNEQTLIDKLYAPEVVLIDGGEYVRSVVDALQGREYFNEDLLTIDTVAERRRYRAYQNENMKRVTPSPVPPVYFKDIN